MTCHQNPGPAYNLVSDGIDRTMFKGSVLSAGSIRFHGYPFISGETHLLFGEFACHGLLVLHFHWSIHSYRSRCLSMDVLSPGSLAALHIAPFLRLFVPNSLTVFPSHIPKFPACNVHLPWCPVHLPHPKYCYGCDQIIVKQQLGNHDPTRNSIGNSVFNMVCATRAQSCVLLRSAPHNSTVLCFLCVVLAEAMYNASRLVAASVERIWPEFSSQ
jgi:hypothetical protein